MRRYVALVALVLLVLSFPTALAGSGEITVQSGVFISLAGTTYSWAPGSYGSCTIGVSSTNCGGVTVTQTTNTGAGPGGGGGPSGGCVGQCGGAIGVICGPNTTYSVALNECVGSAGTTEVGAPVTGNPAQIPEGLAIFAVVMFITVIAVYARKGGKDLGVHSGKSRGPSGPSGGKTGRPEKRKTD